MREMFEPFIRDFCAGNNGKCACLQFEMRRLLAIIQIRKAVENGLPPIGIFLHRSRHSNWRMVLIRFGLSRINHNKHRVPLLISQMQRCPSPYQLLIRISSLIAIPWSLLPIEMNSGRRSARCAFRELMHLAYVTVALVVHDAHVNKIKIKTSTRPHASRNRCIFQHSYRRNAFNCVHLTSSVLIAFKFFISCREKDDARASIRISCA